MKKTSFLRSIGRFLTGKVLPKGIAYPIILGPLKGFRFILGAAAGEGCGATVFINQLEREQSQTFIAKVKPGMVFFDVGANVGYYTLLGSRLVAENGIVVSVEPIVRNLSYLWQHIEKNGLKNVIVLPMACSDIASGIEGLSFGINSAEGRLSTLLNSDSKIDTWTSVVTLDLISQQTGLKPDVIKIDVEGAEMKVLSGAKETISGFRPKIFLSVHSNKLGVECLKFLNDFGYSIVALSNLGEEDAEYFAY